MASEVCFPTAFNLGCREQEPRVILNKAMYNVTATYTPLLLRMTRIFLMPPSPNLARLVSRHSERLHSSLLSESLEAVDPFALASHSAAKRPRRRRCEGSEI